jgi:protein AATF/BFR2
LKLKIQLFSYSKDESYVVKAFNQLIELQQRICISDPETKNLVSTVDESRENENKTLKRKKNGLNNSIGSEDDENEEEEDEEDEEIYSDTDEEMRANEMKRIKKQKLCERFKYKLLDTEDLEQYLNEFNQKFKKYRNATIQKWYDKTRLTTGKSFAALEKPIVQQIEHILADRERIIKRTQLKRTQLKICGKEESQTPASYEEQRDRHLKDYDVEIFDDQDFYNQLLRELIDRKSSSITDPVELARKSIELQKLKSKNKKQVDTKASKGRKIRFDVHKPMINFMAPIYKCTVPEQTRNELFCSLFGNHITLATSNDQNQSESTDFSNIFKSF